MFSMYGVGLVVWLMLMDVGVSRSWDSFNISQGKHFVFLIVRCAIAAVVVYLLVRFSTIRGEINWPGAIFSPVGTVFYYSLYILFNKKRRESWKELLVLDRWNAVALVGCGGMAFCASIVK